MLESFRQLDAAMGALGQITGRGYFSEQVERGLQELLPLVRLEIEGIKAIGPAEHITDQAPGIRMAAVQDGGESLRAQSQEDTEKVYYKMFYSGSGGQDKAAHAFHKETGWNMVWGTDSDGLNGDTWVVYRNIEDLPKIFQRTVSRLAQLQEKELHTPQDVDTPRKNDAAMQLKRAAKPRKLPIFEKLAAAKSQCDPRDAVSAPLKCEQKDRE